MCANSVPGVGLHSGSSVPEAVATLPQWLLTLGVVVGVGGPAKAALFPLQPWVGLVCYTHIIFHINFIFRVKSPSHYGKPSWLVSLLQNFPLSQAGLLHSALFLSYEHL